MQGAEEGTGSGNHESSEILGPRKRASNIFKPSTTFGEWVTRLVISESSVCNSYGRIVHIPLDHQKVTSLQDM